MVASEIGCVLFGLLVERLIEERAVYVDDDPGAKQRDEGKHTQSYDYFQKSPSEKVVSVIQHVILCHNFDFFSPVRGPKSEFSGSDRMPREANPELIGFSSTTR
jgi:hypothetical protein